jgi:hypothetical protein
MQQDSFYSYNTLIPASAALASAAKAGGTK